MSNETQKVDVLAVLDRCARLAANSRSKLDAAREHHASILNARAAAAALIEASRKVTERCWTHMGNDSLYEMTDLRNVLARIVGDA